MIWQVLPIVNNLKLKIMETGNLQSFISRSKYWYLLLILGLIFIAMGFRVFFTPVSSFVALSMFFAFTFLISGIFEISYAISNRKTIDNWGWNLVGGIIDLIIGFILITHPGASMVFLIFYVGFALIFRSIMTIGWSVQLNKMGIKNWGWILVLGILGLIFSFMLLWNPLFTGLAIVIYLGVAFIMIGIAQIFLSLRLRKLKKMYS